MRRLQLGLLLAAGALIGTGVLLGAPAAAQSAHLDQYGWWLIANYDPTATAPYAAPDSADLHVGYGPNPDAAEKQDVMGPVNGPTEISAARYTLSDPLPDGTAGSVPVATLVLPVDATYTPVVSPQASILACASLNPWSPAKGGNWQVRDTYDTGGACSAGTYDSGKDTFTFALTAEMVQSARYADFALVPGYVPVGVDPSNPPNPNSPPQASWKVDLLPPADGSLTPLATSSSSVGSGFSLPSEAASVPSLGALPPSSVIGGGAAAGAPPAAPGPTAQPGYSVPTSVAGGAARLASIGRERLIAAVLLLLLLLGGLTLMSLDVQRLLTPAGQTGGLGRFARRRTAPPVPI